VKALFPLIGLGIAISGCATHKSVGVKYGATGNHDFAVHYMAAANASAGNAPESQQALIDSINNSLANLGKEYDDAKDAGRSLDALGAAIRQQELLIWASGNQIPGFDPNTVNDLVKSARKAALEQAQERMDRHAGESNTEKEMETVRQALGLAPNNPDFVSRYKRLKNLKERRILLRSKCRAQDQVHCDAALAQLAAILTDAKREAIVISTPVAQKEDALLTLSLTTTERETNWGMLRSGNAANEVKVYNEFKEAKKDKEGRAITRTVSANWRVYGANSSSSMAMKVEVKSLRSDRSVLFSASDQDKKVEKRTYYDWNGDHRALGYEVTRHGQNQTLPPRSRVLSDNMRSAMTSKIAKNILNKLEY